MNRTLFRDSRFLLGLALLSLMSFCGLFAPILAPYPPGAMEISQRLLPPQTGHWLGTDLRGIDVWTSLLYGARMSLGVSAVVLVLCQCIGIVVGLTAGFYEKWAGQILMRLIDVLMAFPGILLSLALSAFLPPSVLTLIFSITVTGWIGVARLVRGEVLSLKERDFITAARAIGAHPMSILFKHLLPHIAPVLLVQMTLSISSVIIVEASLSFLGLGPHGQFPTWGQLLSEGRTVIGSAPFLAIAPGVAVFLVVLSANLLGDSIKDFFDPRRN